MTSTVPPKATPSASSSVRSTMLEAELAQREAQLGVINEIGEALSRQLDFQAIIEMVGDRVGAIIGTPDISVALYDPATNMVSFPYTVEDGQRFPQEPIE